MYNLRDYAIGHSYLKHGPFNGWQTDGFWGMAASAPECDYFHKFQEGLKASFDCNIEAIAENHAPYERLCTTDATPEKYRSSGDYRHMQEVLESFKPNVISVFIGGGNTPANDVKSLTQFFEVLYELIARYKLPEAVVICVTKNIYQHKMSKSVADKYGFISVDVSFIHEKKGKENPYYAFNAYPEYDEAKTYKAEAEDVERIIACITATRARRAEMNVPPSKKAKMFVVTKYEETFKRASKILEKLASASEVIITDKYESDDAVMIATEAGSLYIPLAEVIDFEKERARLTAEMKKNDGEIERIEKKLANEGFVAKAPAAVIDGEKAKLAKYLEVRESLKVALAKLS